jgi:hypothetical protein
MGCPAAHGSAKNANVRISRPVLEGCLSLDTGGRPQIAHHTKAPDLDKLVGALIIEARRTIDVTGAAM